MTCTVVHVFSWKLKSYCNLIFTVFVFYFVNKCNLKAIRCSVFILWSIFYFFISSKKGQKKMIYQWNTNILVIGKDFSIIKHIIWNRLLELWLKFKKEGLGSIIYFSFFSLLKMGFVENELVHKTLVVRTSKTTPGPLNQSSKRKT